MAYEKTVWENNVTPLNADNMNKIEDELEELDQSAKSEYVVISSSGVTMPESGTFTSEQLAILKESQNNYIKVGLSAGYYLDYHYSSHIVDDSMIYTNIDNPNSVEVKIIEVDYTSGDWTYKVVPTIPGMDTATAGQVPTSDGQGGIIWTTPQGGSGNPVTQLYGRGGRFGG